LGSARAEALRKMLMKLIIGYKFVNWRKYGTSKRTLRRVFVCENMEKAQSAVDRNNTCCYLMMIKAMQRTTTFA